MKKTFWHHITVFIALLGCLSNAYAVPAPHKITVVTQPDGTELSIWLKGDEFFHFAVSLDGYILQPNEKGFYTYAVPDSSGTLKIGTVIARNENVRSVTDQAYLKTIKHGSAFADIQQNTALNKRIQRAMVKQSALRSAEVIPAGLINDYPRTGSPKSIVILVNFADSVFKPANTNTSFYNMLNQTGYNQGLHVGSVRDYFKYNSGGIFTPDFVVVGPVTLSKGMAYYGQNDKYDDDLYPAQMIKEACELADATVNFSNFDYNGDGIVDNVYVFYAGKGEADGGIANTIWPHSWSLSEASLSLTLDGKKIDDYACSAELNGSGVRTGIGTFTHEYGHILGLPDFYDVDYEYNGESFDLGEWSLMAYGSYNGSGCVPPCLSVLENKLLGWRATVKLNSASSVILSDYGSANQGYQISTNNIGEYFLLENRQQTLNPWDAYLPWHGMLAYHIDMRSDAGASINYWGETKHLSFAQMWTYNMVNAVSSHQCADIEEADNGTVVYNGRNASAYFLSMRSDPFPGLSDIKSFTDSTTPSMITWNGTMLGKPIFNIKEINKEISFDFMGGIFDTPPTALSASQTGNYKFTANWASLNRATGYYLDVYTLAVTDTGDTVKNYLPDYHNLFIEDTFCIINDLEDITTYYYEIRGANNYVITENSSTISVITTKASYITPYVKDRIVYLKGMDRGATVKIYDLRGIVRYTSSTNKIAVKIPGIYLVEAAFEGKRAFIKVLVP